MPVNLDLLRRDPNAAPLLAAYERASSAGIKGSGWSPFRSAGRLSARAQEVLGTSKADPYGAGQWLTNKNGAATVEDEPNYFARVGLPILGAGAGAAFLPALFGVGGAAAGGGASAATGAGTAAGTTAATGGGLMAKLGGLGGILGKVGPIAAQAAKGRAEGRIAEANYGLNRDALAQRGALGNIDADSTRLRQAILLSLLSGAEDAKVTPPAHIADRMGQISGGLRPSALKGREDIVNAARQRILESLMSGQHVPGLSDAPSSSWLDTLLSGVGTVGGFAGALGLGKKAAVAPVPSGFGVSDQSGSVLQPGVGLPPAPEPLGASGVRRGLRGYRFDR